MTIVFFLFGIHMKSLHRIASWAKLRYDFGVILFGHISAMFHTGIAGANGIRQPEISWMDCHYRQIHFISHHLNSLITPRGASSNCSRSKWWACLIWSPARGTRLSSEYIYICVYICKRFCGFPFVLTVHYICFRLLRMIWFGSAIGHMATQTSLQLDV